MTTPIQRLDRAMARVVDPCSCAAGAPLSLTDMGLILARWVAPDGAVEVDLGVTGPGCTFVGLLVEAVEREVHAEFGVLTPVRVHVDPSFVWTEAAMSERARHSLAQRRRATVVGLGLRPRMWQEVDA